MGSKPKHNLADLKALSSSLKAAREAQEKAERERAAREAAERRAAREFETALEGLGGVQPLAERKPARVQHPRVLPEAIPMQTLLDEQAALQESISDIFGVEQLLETDDNLSYRQTGIGSDVLKKLRRGTWSIQAEVDLHGYRTDEAREALGAFLADCQKRGIRCVRVIHGKGLNSEGRTPVLKSKVRSWLVQRDTVLAFVQATAADGGSGALVVLLKGSAR